jgi:hypothetical protein
VINLPTAVINLTRRGDKPTDGGESWFDDEDGCRCHHPVIILGIAIAAAADTPLSQRVIRIRQTQRLLNKERKLLRTLYF